MRRRVPTYVLTLGLLVAFCVLALGACGGAEQPKQQQQRQEQEPQTKTFPNAGKPLSAGRYVTDVFEPAMSFRVGDGWVAAAPETHDAVPLIEENGPTIIGFLNVEEVFDPSQPNERVPAPDDILAWLQEHPRLDTEEPSRVSVGGVDGRQFDAISDRPIDAKICAEPCTPLFAFGDGNDFWVGESEKYRFVVLEDVEGETVTIFFGGPAVEFEELLPKAQKVVDSVTWSAS
jgi:hypothetical protein